MSEDEAIVGTPKVTMNADGKVLSGGHAISEEDYWFVVRELREQFSCLAGRLYGIVDATLLNEKQAKAYKRLLKREVWERYDDLAVCLAEFSRVPYSKDVKSNLILGGQPLDETNID